VNDRTLRVTTGTLAAVGVGITTYLVIERYTRGVISCTTGGCETVQSSSYSKIAGIPVAVLGLVTYLAIFALAFLRSEVAHAALLALALAGVAFSGYLSTRKPCRSARSATGASPATPS